MVRIRRHHLVLVYIDVTGCCCDVTGCYIDVTGWCCVCIDVTGCCVCIYTKYAYIHTQKWKKQPNKYVKVVPKFSTNIYIYIYIYIDVTRCCVDVTGCYCVDVTGCCVCIYRRHWMLCRHHRVLCIDVTRWYIGIIGCYIDVTVVESHYTP